jgi:predicted MFS family arabinose efflux permease
MILLGVTLFALPLVGESHAGASADILLWGMAYGALPVALSVWVSQYAGDHAEASSALFVMTYQLAIAAGSLVGGRVVDGFGVVPALVVGGIAVLIALVLQLSFGTSSPMHQTSMPPETSMR